MRKPKNNMLNKLFSSLNKEVKEFKRINQNSSTANLYDRREFISQTAKGAIGVTLALGLPSFLSSCGNQTKSDDSAILDIAILGGGIAGLNCANHLLDSKLNFKIFEASKRMGGRIYTNYDNPLNNETYPEFGGNFIDSNHEDMLNLAKEFDLKLIDFEQIQKDKKLSKDIFYFDNRKISEEEVIREFKKIAPKIANDIELCGEDYDTEDAERLDNIALKDYIESLDCNMWLKELLNVAFTSEMGLDTSEQSTLNFLGMIDTNTSEGFKIFGESDERYWIKGGNEQIIKALVNKIGADKINTASEVIEITENENGIYDIKFKNEKIIKTKHIVCTIPFSVLRKINLNIKNISEEKRKCIDELGYGQNTKLILGFAETTWSKSPNNAMGYLFHSDIQNGWDNSYKEDSINLGGTYVCYFGGSSSIKLHKIANKQKLPDNVVKDYVDKLDSVFINSKRQFTNNHVFVDWIGNPLSKGSYSCYKVGQWSTIAGLEAEPIGNFFFAGEHCSEDFQGYMNGGAETGRKVAETISSSKDGKNKI
jgi:monoamine oxidase